MDTQDDIDKVARILMHGYCSGYHCKGAGIAQEDHECPYSSEINNDHSTCNCCEECEYQCSMDI